MQRPSHARHRTGSSRRGDDSPVRGRDAEIESIAALLGALSHGNGGALVLRGAPGLGKSRLLREAQRMAARQSAILASGDPLLSLIPYSALGPAVRALGPPFDAHRCLDELEKGTASADWARAELADQFEAAALREGTVWLLDDLQWFDRSSIAFLAHLARRSKDLPVAWIIGVRGGDLPPFVAGFVQDLVGHAGRAMKLQPLDDTATRDIVKDRLGAAPDDRMMQLIDRADRIPLHVHEMLSGLLDESAVQWANGSVTVDAASPPRSWGATTRERILTASRDTQILLTLGAVIGRSFRIADVASLSGRPRAMLAIAAQEALASELLEDAGPLLSFPHDVVREAALSTLPEDVRHAFSYDVAMLRLSAGEGALDVADMLAASATPGDASAIRVLIRAATELVDRDAVGAGDVARRAIELSVEGARPPELSDLVPVLWRSGDRSAARGLLRLLPDLDGPRQAHALTALARLETERSFEAALEYCGQALAISSLSDRHRAELLALRSMNLQNAGRWDQVAAADRDALAAARLAGEPRIEATVSIVESARAFYSGDFSAAENHVADARAAVVRAGGSEGLWLPEAIWPALLTGALGDPQSAVTAADSGLGESRRLRDSAAAAWWMMLRTRGLYEAGLLEEAWAQGAELFASSEKLDLGLFSAAIAGTAMYRVALLRADGAALDEMEEAVDSMLSHEGSIRRAGLWLRALRADAEGKRENAVALCAEPIAALGTPTTHLNAPPDFADDVILTRVLMSAGSADVVDVQAFARERSARNPQNLLALAVSTHIDGLLHASPEVLASAVKILRDVGRPLVLASALEDAGKVGGADLAGTRRLWMEAHSIYDEAGAVRHAARVRQRLRETGLRVQRTTAAAKSGSLSPTEYEVARLVSEELTTAEMARALSISSHTVVTHVRHIYAKLSLSSRAELRNWYRSSDV